MNKINVIKTKRFFLKPLLPRHASQKYLAWLQDGASRRYITAAKKIKQLKELQKYIKIFSSRNDCIFLRIMTKKTNRHIGNIKYHPIDSERKTAVMGMLVGEPSWRGKRVAKEVLKKSAIYLKINFGIRKLYLGVNIKNISAIRAYRKIGFKNVKRWSDKSGPRSGQKIMVWNLA